MGYIPHKVIWHELTKEVRIFLDERKKWTLYNLARQHGPQILTKKDFKLFEGNGVLTRETK